MKLISRLLTWPIRAMWRATAPKHFPQGEPFDMRGPTIIDGQTLRYEGRTITLWGVDAPRDGEPGAHAARRKLIELCANRHIHVVPRARQAQGCAAQLYCGRGDIGPVDGGLGCRPRRRPTYAKFGADARSKNAGIWKNTDGPCGLIEEIA